MTTIGFVVVDALFFGTLPIYIREPVISQISGVFLTIEGVLIGLTLQIKNKKLSNIIAYIGILAILVAVATFAKSTYEEIQLGWLSYFPTSLLFQATASLFLGFIELYALAILYPFTPKDPDKSAIKKVAETW